MTATTATRPADRLQCRCGTRRTPEVVKRDMGRSKSYRLRCPGCRKESATTFYPDRLTDKWNEVASK